MHTPHILARMVRRFKLRGSLEPDDESALLDLPHRVQTVEPHSFLAREGDRLEQCCLLLSGFAYRHKVTAEGSRQIVSLHIPGDLIDIEAALLNVADHNIQALTRCDVAFIPRAAMRALILSRPRIAAAMWVDTLIDGSIFREWVLNVGRRDARGRIAHLLCEFARRLQAAGLAEEYAYELPMTQEQLADATGLTAVHVNRVLKALTAEGLIERERRFLRIPDWTALRRAAGFSELYLHLDQTPGVAGGVSASRRPASESDPRRTGPNLR